MMEDKINQMEEKLSSFQLRSQSIITTGVNKKENSTKDQPSTMTLRALEHQLAKLQNGTSGHNTTRSSKISASRVEGHNLSLGDGRKIEQAINEWLEEVEKQVNTIED